MNNEVSQLYWNGIKPEKFKGCRRHIAEPRQDKDTVHIDSVKSRKHFYEQRNKHQNLFLNSSNQEQSIHFERKIFPNLVTRESSSEPFVSSIKYIQFIPSPKLSTGERVHYKDNNSQHLQKLELGRRKFIDIRNKESNNTYSLNESIFPNLNQVSNNVNQNKQDSKNSQSSPEY